MSHIILGIYIVLKAVRTLQLYAVSGIRYNSLCTICKTLSRYAVDDATRKMISNIRKRSTSTSRSKSSSTLIWNHPAIARCPLCLATRLSFASITGLWARQIGSVRRRGARRRIWQTRMWQWWLDFLATVGFIVEEHIATASPNMGAKRRQSHGG